MKGLTFLLLTILTVNYSFSDDYVVNNKKFPDGFWFGSATSSYQVEGGWDADGKGENMWDHITHTMPFIIADGSNGDVACDSYHQYETDVEMMKYLGLTHYRFSISWARVLPTGLVDNVNEAGVKYYKNLISKLVTNGITPLVTMYHWDLPQPLFEQGGLMNETFIDWFGDYARFLYEQLGDDVQHWGTFNEATYACYQMGMSGQTFNPYQCGHNVLRAHAAAYHIYQNEFKDKQGGKVSMVHAIDYNGPATNSTEDIEAAERKMQFDLGWWLNPLYFGDYPDVMKERVAANSEPGQSRLPEFTEEEKAALKGTSDYVCFNTYYSYLAKNRGSTNPKPDKDGDTDVDSLPNPNYPNNAWGMKLLTQWIQKHYDDPDMIITENGLGTDADEDYLNDDDRITVIQDYLSGIRDAMDAGVKVFGYTAWSLMDNFEWNSGYTKKFGIYHVDFTSDNRTRTAKKSAEFYKKVISTRCLVDECV